MAAPVPTQTGRIIGTVVDALDGTPLEKVSVRVHDSRLDARVNRTFSMRATRLTLFAEVLNLYARERVRASQPGINGITHQVFGLFDSMFPLIPSVGLSVEF